MLCPNMLPLFEDELWKLYLMKQFLILIFKFDIMNLNISFQNDKIDISRNPWDYTF